MAAMQVTGVIAAVIAVGVVLAGMSLHLARGVNALHRDTADLRARMARIEGLFAGFMARSAADARPVSPCASCAGVVQTVEEEANV